MIENRYLSKAYCSFLKGISITIIVIHNLCTHITNYSNLNNEREFLESRNLSFLERIINFDKPIYAIFDHYGHFGIIVFLFISGYGLSMKYKNKEIGNFRNYIYYSAKKLYKLIFPIVLIYLFSSFAYYTYKTGSLWIGLTTSVNNNYLDTLIVFTFLGNFIRFNCFNGPMWYISLTMQLYVLFYFIHNRSRIFLFSIILLSLIIQSFYLYIGDTDTLSWIRYNFIGWLLPFIFGVIYVNHPVRDKNNGLSALFFAIFLFAGFNKYIWLLQPFFLIMSFLYLEINLNKMFCKFFAFVGSFSSYIYISHGMFRDLATNFDTSLLQVSLYVIISFVFAYFLKHLCCRVYNSPMFGKSMFLQESI